MHKPKVFSFFSGAGFLDLGFEKNGFEISFVNEIHAPFANAYIYSREQMGLPHPELGYMVEGIDSLLSDDGIKKIKQMVNAAKKQSLVGFIGGPPCPDFSVAGKNKGRNGENGKLSKSYIDLICATQPSFFLFENVKGLWRTVKHRAFYEDLKKQLIASGYQLDERLINAIEYGAPQDRDRIILIGLHKSVLSKGIAPNAEAHKINLPWESQLKFPNRTAFTDFDWAPMDGNEASPQKRKKVVCEELTVSYWFKKNQVQIHPNSGDCFIPRAGLEKFQTVSEGDVSKKSYKRLHRNRYSPTAAYGNNEVHIHPTLPRRISVAEALAIQSLPKEFCLPPKMTLTDKFKTIGNGVPYLAACGLAKTIHKFIEENVRETDSSQSRQSNIQTSQAKVVRIHQRALWDASEGQKRRIA